MNSNLETVEFYPRWRRSRVVGDATAFDERSKLAESVDIRKYFTFVACDPLDQASPPSDWDGALPNHLKKLFGENHQVRMVYYPRRIFIVPRSDLVELIKRFKVAWNYAEDREFHELVGATINSIDAIAKVELIEVDDSGISMSFVGGVSDEQAKSIEAMFDCYNSNTSRLGLEDYLSEWDPSSSKCPLAERIYVDQMLKLWWD